MSTFNYRELARQRFEKHAQLQNKEKEEKDKLEKEKKLQEELEHQRKALEYGIIEETISNLETTVIRLLSSDNALLIENLITIESIIISNIIKIKEFDKLNNLQNIIYNLVEVMNNINNKRNNNLKFINDVHTVMKRIFELCEVDITIELMDTTEDINYAKNIYDKMFDTSKDEEIAKNLFKKINKYR